MIRFAANPIPIPAGTGNRRRGTRGFLGAMLAAATCLPAPGAGAAAAAEEGGYEAWLRYPPLHDQAMQARQDHAITAIVSPDDANAVAAAELQRGLAGLLGRPVPVVHESGRAGAIFLISQAGQTNPALVPPDVLHGLGPEAYLIRQVETEAGPATVIAGRTERAVLYGTFDLLRRVQLGEPVDRLEVSESPSVPLRMVNQWDNLDGTVERGYAGRSIFHWDELPTLNPRYEDYARLLASVGLNGVCLNNVNAGKGRNIEILTPTYLEKVAALAEVLRRYGVTTYLAVGFDAPRKLGGLATADPLDPAVRDWWAAKAEEIYGLMPDFGGFVIKADSEGQPGPYRYGRDHADGANMLADALRPHGGIVIWRAFVYDLGDGQLDRAAMAYDTFKPLDGRFHDNVLVQIKNGPIDFQVREPVHPLFGAMPATRVALELQITQEYTGHDTHLCYLVPSWKQVLDFDTHARGNGSTVRDDLDGDLFGRTGAIVAVLNVGEDRTWLGHPLHMANFYGYGRLAWDATISSEAIAEEWTRLTFGDDPEVVDTLVSMLMASYEAYEGYTSPLGLGVMHDVPRHYDPSPRTRQYYHQADHEGVGFDRTQATGSGYTGQYHPPVAARYESLETCPEELLLFFHHVPYTHRLSNGRTVIQHLYDAHTRGVEQVETMRAQWQALEGRVDPRRYEMVLAKLTEQLAHAKVWRDEINGFFFERSGIADESAEPRPSVPSEQTQGALAG